MRQFEKARSHILGLCHDDFAGLWLLLGEARDLAQDMSDGQFLGLLRELLESRLVVAGHPSKDGATFIPWASTPEDTISRISREWLALQRDPNIGEIAWFTTTASGDAAVSRSTDAIE
jgi:hypothetical protein